MDPLRDKKALHGAQAMPVTHRSATIQSYSNGEVVPTCMDQNKKGIDMHGLPSGVGEAYETKVAILNQALVDLGMGGFQWKIFAMTGFGWFVDNVGTHTMNSRRITLT